MILTKLRFENQQKKTPQSKKTKASFILFGRIIYDDPNKAPL
jgi:hypothetical protein